MSLCNLKRLQVRGNSKLLKCKARANYPKQCLMLHLWNNPNRCFKSQQRCFNKSRRMLMKLNKLTRLILALMRTIMIWTILKLTLQHWTVVMMMNRMQTHWLSLYRRLPSWKSWSAGTLSTQLLSWPPINDLQLLVNSVNYPMIATLS